MDKKMLLKKMSKYYDGEFENLFAELVAHNQHLEFTDSFSKYPLLMFLDKSVVLWQQSESVAYHPHAFTTEPEILLIILSRSEEHTSELQSRGHLVCRLLLEKKK